MKNQYVLRVEFINKVYSGRKIVKETLSGNTYVYRGITKKECIAQAKAKHRYNSSYKATFEVENIED